MLTLPSVILSKLNGHSFLQSPDYSELIMERESLEMDVVFVGAGPANLSGALHLSHLIAEHNEKHANALGEIQIAVIEKGATVGSHILSGAVMDPRGLAELIPDFKEKGAPLESE